MQIRLICHIIVAKALDPPAQPPQLQSKCYEMPLYGRTDLFSSQSDPQFAPTTDEPSPVDFQAVPLPVYLPPPTHHPKLLRLSAHNRLGNPPSPFTFIGGVIGGITKSSDLLQGVPRGSTPPRLKESVAKAAR